MGNFIDKPYYDKNILFKDFLVLYDVEIKRQKTEQQLSLINDFLEEKNISAQEMKDIIKYYKPSWMEKWGEYSFYVWVIISIIVGLSRLFGIIISTNWILLLSAINLAIFLGFKAWGHKQYKYYRHIDELLFELSIRPYLKKDHVVS